MATDTVIDTDIEDLLKSVEEKQKESRVILYNDDFNSFDHVVESLMEVLKCPEEEAYVYTLQAHKTGRATIKKGTRYECEKVAVSLSILNLTTEVTD